MRRRMLVLAVMLPACLVPTEVGIEVDIESALRERAATLVVTSAGPLEFVDVERLELRDQALPVTKYIVPRGGDADRTFRVDFELLDEDGQSMLRRRVVGGYEERTLRLLRVQLTSDCVGVECGAGRSCAAGVCRPVCYDGTRTASGLSEPQECGGECSSLEELAPCQIAGRAGLCRSGACCTGCWDPSSMSCSGGDDADACGASGKICNECCPGESCGSAGCSPPDDAVVWIDANDDHTCVATATESYCFGANDQAIRVAGDSPPILRQPVALGLVGRLDTGNRGACAAGDPGVVCREAPSSNRPLAPRLGRLAGAVLSRIAVGDNHACGIQDGELVCWGENTHGQLGQEARSEVRGPNPVENQGPATWTDVRASHNLTCATREDQTWWCWGRRSDWLDAMSASSSGEDYELVQIQGPPGVGFGQLAVSRRGACAIGTDESLYCVGRLVDEALSCPGAPPTGLLATMIRSGPLLDFAISADSVCVLFDGDAEARLECRGTAGVIGERLPNACEFVPYEYGGPYRALTVGRDHGCMTRRDGALYCFGSNRLGQIAEEEDIDRSPHPRRVCLP